MLDRLAEELWKRGVDVSLGEMKKWVGICPENIEETADALAKIKERAGKDWFVIVVLNQTEYMFENNDERAEYIKKLGDADAHPVAVIITWRTEMISPTTAIYGKADIPKYYESTNTVIDFFKNVLKYEQGVDFDPLEKEIKTVVDERYVDEFFRLVDVDRPMEPEEFVGRVEKALDILNTAKEQGLDVKAVFKKWDELADAGGERLEKLPLAVKAVAEEAVRERFWKRIKEILEENDVRVFNGELPEDTLSAFYYLGMVDIRTDDVDVSGAEAYITKIAALLKKARAIPMYSVDEIAKIIKRAGVQKVADREEAEFVASVLSQLERGAAKVFTEDDVGDVVVDVILRAKREGVEEDQIVSAVNEVLLEVFHGSVAGSEEIAHFLEKKLLS